MLPVSDEEITLAEQILLPDGYHFDDERRNFISCLETCDLQAVPGSGKTTALLAKLIILEKRLPIKNGKGILVLSHTNVAIEEIKDKLKGHCTKIFSYPNFVGTIQGFVDEFLAIPYYINKYGKKPVRIDNEICDEKILKYRLPFGANAWVNAKHDPESFKKNLRLNVDGILIPTFRSDPHNLGLKYTTPTYQALLKMKTDILERGYLHFDDAYYFAEKYIREMPDIITLLRTRFIGVYVDEMQDMESHQSGLLETLFHNDVNQPVYQRIGDNNQSIFSGRDANTEAEWIVRPNLLRLTGSHRLSQQVANVVRPFGVYSDTQIRGYHPSTLPPHLFIFNPNEHALVLPTFGRVIKQYQDEGTFPIQLRHPIKAIGWVGKPADGGNLFIPDYFPAFNKENKATKIDHSSLLGYLIFYDKTKNTFSGIRTSILNGILRILRDENLNYNTRDYTKKNFLFDLKISSRSLFDEFNINLYNWCLSVLKGDVHIAHRLITQFIPNFISRWKGVAELSQTSQEFLNSQVLINVEEERVSTNLFIHDDLKIEVDTVHSVKGQTHSATLYMETFYYSYESQKCMDQLLGRSAAIGLAARKREASKIMYVGLSRATNLLCVAISRDRLGNREADLRERGWRIITC